MCGIREIENRSIGERNSTPISLMDTTMKWRLFLVAVLYCFNLYAYLPFRNQFISRLLENVYASEEGLQEVDMKAMVTDQSIALNSNLMISQSACAFLVIGSIGAFADIIGRKRILFLSGFGQLFEICLCLISTIIMYHYMADNVEFELKERGYRICEALLYIGSTVNGLCGSYGSFLLACYAMAADISKDDMEEQNETGSASGNKNPSESTDGFSPLLLRLDEPTKDVYHHEMKDAEDDRGEDHKKAKRGNNSNRKQAYSVLLGAITFGGTFGPLLNGQLMKHFPTYEVAISVQVIVGILLLLLLSFKTVLPETYHPSKQNYMGKRIESGFNSFKRNDEKPNIFDWLKHNNTLYNICVFTNPQVFEPSHLKECGNNSTDSTFTKLFCKHKKTIFFYLSIVFVLGFGAVVGQTTIQYMYLGNNGWDEVAIGYFDAIFGAYKSFIIIIILPSLYAFAGKDRAHHKQEKQIQIEENQGNGKTQSQRSRSRNLTIDQSVTPEDFFSLRSWIRCDYFMIVLGLLFYLSGYLLIGFHIQFYSKNPNILYFALPLLGIGNPLTFVHVRACIASLVTPEVVGRLFSYTSSLEIAASLLSPFILDYIYRNTATEVAWYTLASYLFFALLAMEGLRRKVVSYQMKVDERIL